MSNEATIPTFTTDEGHKFVHLAGYYFACTKEGRAWQWQSENTRLAIEAGEPGLYCDGVFVPLT